MCVFWVCGLVVVDVTLIGLGSDQVGKTMVSKHNVESHYIDEHKGEDTVNLKTHLASMTNDEWEEKVVIVFIPAVALTTNPKTGIPLPWIKAIQRKVDHRHVSLWVVDDAHYLPQKVDVILVHNSMLRRNKSKSL